MQLQHTQKEEYAMKFFSELGMHEPSNIDEKYICRQLGLHLKATGIQSHFQRMGSVKVIYINRHLSRQQARLEFFHKLGHLIRHHKDTDFAHPLFREWLEWDAKHFEYYTAMPFHMMRRFNFQDPTIVYILADAFLVPTYFVEKKLRLIRERQKDYQKARLSKE